jgi:hypothetical protein
MGPNPIVKMIAKAAKRRYKFQSWLSLSSLQVDFVSEPSPE